MHEHNHETAPRIVVGVDGSPCSISALRWAMAQARLVGASVEAVTTWRSPSRYGMAYGMAPIVFDSTGIAEITQKVLDEAVAEVSAGMDQPVDVVTRVVEGHPAEALLQAADGALLLVVGSRGHGTLAGMLLGSVSQHCVQHSPCPVVVLPA